MGILPVEDDHIYLVGQYRYPLRKYSREIPECGCAEGEDTLVATRREIEEESGLRALVWRRLGKAHLFNSVSDELAVWYVATGLEESDARPESSEQLVVRQMPFKAALRMALTGEITDALSLVALMQYRLTSGDGG
jgi:8-oxo-dGTP pyrophosphatase MutT (NUDIX family)